MVRNPPAVMIFQDGAGFRMNAAAACPGGPRQPDPQKADARHHRPLHRSRRHAALTPEQIGRYHRSHEYDASAIRTRGSSSRRCPRSLASSTRSPADPNDRGLAGGSSGGIASFVAAWQRPDAFRRVISFIGSYANLRGGDSSRHGSQGRAEAHPRVHAGRHATRASIAAAGLSRTSRSPHRSNTPGYDVKFVVGTEGHSGRHGSAILPDALRWLWRDYPKPIVASKGGPGSRHYITDFLDPAADWQVVGQGYGAAGATAVDKEGAVYFADTKAAKSTRSLPKRSPSRGKRTLPSPQ